MYQNMLMLYCRRSMHFTPQKVAEMLEMPISLYKDLESGNVLMDYAQARKLAKFYDTEAKYFYESAQQLDHLLSIRILVKTLKTDNERLRGDLENVKKDLGRT